MNAVAGVYGASHDARAALTRLLDRMPARSAGTRVVSPPPLSGPAAVIAAAGSTPAAHDEPGVAVLAGDIRLDNRRELRDALDLDASASDARIALAAFLRWGDGFARALAGDFAILIIDRRRGRGLAVRDHLGIRPLYYRAGPSGVQVASELGALIEPGDLVDEGFLAEALGGDIVDVEATPYAAIRRVPAAHALVVDLGDLGDLGDVEHPAGARLTRYWEPAADVDTLPFAEHAERLRATFDEAVRARTEGAARVGVHVSGGLDSSSVLGSIVAGGLVEPVAASLVLPWPEADERRWIAATARHCGVTPMLVEPPLAPAAHDLAAIATHRDLPDFPSGAPLLSGLDRAFRNAGVDIVLTGVGGDQWWTGETAHMSDLLRAGRLGRLRAWRGAGAAMGEAAWDWPTFLDSGVYPLLPAPVRRAFRRVRPRRMVSWIDARFAARVSLADRLARRPRADAAPSESWRRMRWRLDSGEEAFAKERFDRAAAAHGVELRHPMYDRRLVELAFRTPDTVRIRGGRSRAVLREAMAARLSPETYDRNSKADLTGVLLAAARDPALAPYLTLSRLSARGWIDVEAAAAIVRRAVRDADVDAARPFWSLVGVEAWLRHGFGAE